MNGFDKFCGLFAFALGVVFLVLGVIGLFVGCRANFTLPPVLGVLPAVVGWGMVRGLYWGWSPQIRYIDPKTGEEYRFTEEENPDAAAEPAGSNVAAAVLTFVLVLAVGIVLMLYLMGT